MLNFDNWPTDNYLHLIFKKNKNLNFYPLSEMPRGRLAQLRRMKTMLSNHSEDCLYLNMYVPRDGKFMFPPVRATFMKIRKIKSCGVR